MTKTEAAETMAMQIRVKARRNDRKVTLFMCVEMVSEQAKYPSVPGSELHRAACIANPRAVFAAVKAQEAARS